MELASNAQHPQPEAIEVEIDNRSGKKRKHLAEDQTADNSDTQRAAKLGTYAVSNGQGQSA